MNRSPLLEVENLRVEFRGRGFRAAAKNAVDGVSFNIGVGETLGLVGESGSGKSTIGRAILGLVPVAAGSIRFEGEEIANLSARSRRQTAHGIQVVFQDPYSSLNPDMPIEEILSEPLRFVGRQQARTRVHGLLDAVGLPPDAGRRLAREFSGGQRQRIAIARALALDPKLIVCDEPTSALDMTTQTRVLDLLEDLQKRTGVAYLFISHNLGVVRQMSDRTAVLLDGQIVELGTSDQIAHRPRHPYTRRLIMATPIADPELQQQRRADRLNDLSAYQRDSM